MLVPFKDFGYTIKIAQYTVKQEKELLFLETYYPEFNDDILDAALDILNVKPEIYTKLTHDEKVVLLYKFREISVDEKYAIQAKCPKCGMPIETEISISGLVKLPTKTGKIKNLGRLPNDEEDFLNNFLIDKDISLEEYEDLFEHVEDYQTTLNFIKSFKCLSCGSEVKIDLNSNKTVIESLSECSIQSIYNFYENMIFTGKWSKSDIDSLYPFERVIFSALYEESVKKYNESVMKRK